MILCPHCMNQTEAERFCKHCGGSLQYQAAPHQLPAGTILTDGAFRSFEIGAVKGQGGFGITYVALDLRRKIRVAIKEYFPLQCSQRAGIQVVPTPGMEQVFAGGQANFLNEAKMLASLPALPSVVQIMEYFEVNGTAYIVMEYLDGTPLHHIVQSGVIPAEHLFSRLPALLQDLQHLHAAGVIHRDISPDNVMWMPDGTLKLLDFGSARHLEDGKSVSIQLKHGFAPVEQYLTRGQGPFTDLYALCATVYYCLTGRVPPHAAERLEEDRIQPPTELGAAMEPEWESALMWGLSVQPKVRPQDAGIFLQRMYPNGFPPITSYEIPGVRPVDPPVVSEDPAISNNTPTYVPVVLTDDNEKKKKTGFAVLLEKFRQIPAGTKVLGAVGLVIIILLIVLVCLLAGGRKDEPESIRRDHAVTVDTQQPAAEETPEQPRPEVQPEPEPEPAPEPAPEPEPETPEEWITEDGFVMELVDGEARVIGYQGEDPEPVIPEEAFGCPVTTIAAGAFHENKVVEAVLLPATLSTIEGGAFYRCPNLYALGAESSDTAIHCADTFEDCNRLIVFYMEDPARWESDVPDHVLLLSYELEMDFGTITEFYVSDDGCLYGELEADFPILLKVPKGTTELDLVESWGGEPDLMYITEGAFDSAENLLCLSLPDNCFYYSDFIYLAMNLDELYYRSDSFTSGWTAACIVSALVNETHGAGTMMPDVDLTFLATQRAYDLSESFSYDLPDGSSWGDFLNENEFDWDSGYHWVQQTAPNDDTLFDAIDEVTAELVENPFDEDGNVYDTIACGIVAGTDADTGEDCYNLAWFFLY